MKKLNLKDVLTPAAVSAAYAKMDYMPMQSTWTEEAGFFGPDSKRCACALSVTAIANGDIAFEDLHGMDGTDVLQTMSNIFGTSPSDIRMFTYGFDDCGLYSDTVLEPEEIEIYLLGRSVAKEVFGQ